MIYIHHFVIFLVIFVSFALAETNDSSSSNNNHESTTDSRSSLERNERIDIVIIFNVSSTSAPETIEQANREFHDCLSNRQVVYSNSTQLNANFIGRKLTLENTEDQYKIRNCPYVYDTKTNSNKGPIDLIVEDDKREHHFSDFIHKMTGVDKVHSEFKLFGKGVKVGIIDSGVDMRHEIFGNCSLGVGSPECKVKYGYDFVGDEFTGEDSIPKPDNDPHDRCSGHGTHVAGIVMGSSNEITGVAPEIELGVYRVFGCKGSTTPEVLIQALQRAYEDGMDIVNLSVGDPSGFPSSPESKKIDELVAKGLIVIVAMGNEGQSRLWMANNPAVAKSAIAVTSVDSSILVKRKLKVSVDTSREFMFAFLTEPYSPPNPDYFRLPVVYDDRKSDTTEVPIEGCEPFTADLTKKIIVLARGGCEFQQKAINAHAAGAVGLFVYNNKAGDIGSLASYKTLSIFTMTEDDGKNLIEILKKNKDKEAIAVISGVDEYVSTPEGMGVSSFSTLGIGPDLQIKPDIGAPGGGIYSAYNVDWGNYKLMNGTSMAAPYVSGCYALMLEFLKKTNSTIQKHDPFLPFFMRNRFANYAAPIDRSANDDASAVTVVSQGAGLIQPYAAIQSKSVVSPGKISLGYVRDSSLSSFSITNRGWHKKVYKVSHLMAETLDVTSPLNLTISKSDMYVDFAISTDAHNFLPSVDVVLDPNQSAIIRVRMINTNEQELSHLEYFSGFLEISPLSYVDGGIESRPEDYVMSIPFCGLQGDLTKLSAFDISSLTLAPALLYWKNMASTNIPINEPKELLEINDYDPVTDRMIVQWKQLVPFDYIKVVLVDAASNHSLGVISEGEKLSAPAAKEQIDPTAPKTFSWNMTIVNHETKQLEYTREGTYMVRVQYKRVDFMNYQTSEEGFDLQKIHVLFSSPESKTLYEQKMNDMIQQAKL